MSHEPSVMNRKGFTIVELAVVLVLVGILIALGVRMIGPLTQRAKISETKGTVDTVIESLVGFAVTNRRLPTVAEFTGAAKKSNDAWGNPLYYIVDSNLYATGADQICGRKTTAITVRNCLTNDCTTTAGTDYNDIPDVAFAIVSGGENFNVQTAVAAGRATVYVQNGSTNRDACTTAATCPNYSGTLINRAERYDDIVNWVTLNELRTKIGCAGQQLKVLNNELPSGSVAASYGSAVYGDGGIPFTAGGNYRWCLQTATGVIATDLPGFTVTPNVVNVNCQVLAEGTWGQANNLQLSKTAGSGTAGSYSVTVFVRDNADTAANDNIASRAFVITISP
jgi:prepilin-type N-terminal cleavage/methylation domain-containing protein